MEYGYITLRESGAQNAAGTVTGDNMYLHNHVVHERRQLVVEIDLEAAGAAGGDTLDVYVDTSLDGGNTWINIGRASFANGDAAGKRVLVFDNEEMPDAQPVDLSADMAAEGVRSVGFGPRLRYRGVAGGTTPAFTYGVIAGAR